MKWTLLKSIVFCFFLLNFTGCGQKFSALNLETISASSTGAENLSSEEDINEAESEEPIEQATEDVTEPSLSLNVCDSLDCEPGDVNADGKVDIKDYNLMNDVIFGNINPLGNPDCNRDGRVDGGDIVCINTKIFGR